MTKVMYVPGIVLAYDKISFAQVCLMMVGLLLQLASMINASLCKPNVQKVDEEEKRLLLLSHCSKQRNPSSIAALESNHLPILQCL